MINSSILLALDIVELLFFLFLIFWELILVDILHLERMLLIVYHLIRLFLRLAHV